MNDLSPSAGGTAPPLAVSVLPRWRQLRNDLLETMSSGFVRIVLVGEAGTGKSVMLQEVGRVLRMAGCNLDHGFQDGLADMGGGPRFALVDDADNLSDAELAALMQAPRTSALLTMRPGGERRLPQDDVLTAGLAAFDMQETSVFLSARVQELGHDPDVLRHDAVATLASLSQGRVGPLLSLLTAALFLASTEGAAEVDAACVSRAASSEGAVPQPPTITAPVIDVGERWPSTRQGQNQGGSRFTR